MESPKLDLLGWGPVDAEILWIEGKLLKIKFIHMTESRTELFHFSEIINYSEIFIDKDLKIHKYV
jgi:hypothetical protein